MSIAYVGIDPGKTGAIGIIATEYGCAICDVPVDKDEYDFYRMQQIISRLVTAHASVYLTLEQQQAMPKQGVSSTFQTGLGYGAWRAICTLVVPDFEIVSPRKWKKELGLTSDKEQSRKLAIKLYPSMAFLLKRKKDHNRAEALLLAHYTKLLREEES